jgi:hypothetical protein
MHDLRHVVSAEARYANNYKATVPSDRLVAFDHVEAADAFEEITLRLNQHFQTKVGPKEKREIVNFLWVGAAVEFYPDAERDTTRYRPQNHLPPCHWITLPPEPDGVTYLERNYSNLFWGAELTPKGRLRLRVDGEYDLRDRRPEAVDLTAQADIASWWRMAVGYYEAHNVMRTIRVTAYLKPTPRVNLYAQQENDLDEGEVTGRRFAAQWDLHDVHLEVSAHFDPIRDEKQFLVGIAPKFGRGKSLFPHEREGSPSQVSGVTLQE